VVRSRGGKKLWKENLNYNKKTAEKNKEKLSVGYKRCCTIVQLEEKGGS